MNPFMYMMRRLLFGLLYALGIDIIRQPHKYKETSKTLWQKITTGARKFSQYLLGIAFLLILILFFWHIFVFAMTLALIGVVSVWAFRPRKKQDDDDDDTDDQRPG